LVRGEKKTEKPMKPRKPEKNNRKNQTEKNPIKPIKILKKLADSIRFYKQKTKKTELKLVGLTRFWFCLFFFKIFSLVIFFFIKIESN
jgi:hypothetical protein